MSDDKNNTGHRSTGYRSTGDYSTGNYSTGNRSTGHRSTGYRSTGYRSTGDYSTGDYSTGDYSTGNYSTGNYSTGHRSTGHFCEEDGPVMLFDRETDLTRDEVLALVPWIAVTCGAEWVAEGDMSDEEKGLYPSHNVTGGFLRPVSLPLNQAFKQAWDKLSSEQKGEWQPLFDRPEFDADKFERITGVRIDVKHVDDDAPSEVIVNGVVYVPKA